MPEPNLEDVTRFLREAAAGNRDADEIVQALINQQLRAIAAEQLRGVPASATLQPTALVNECYLRLAGKKIEFADRLHFFRLCGKVMQGIVKDYARRHHSRKRGGDRQRVDLDEIEPVDSGRNIQEMADVESAMGALANQNTEAHDIVLLHFFSGLTHSQISEVKGIPLIRVRRLWELGRALLATLLDPDL